MTLVMRQEGSWLADWRGRVFWLLVAVGSGGLSALLIGRDQSMVALLLLASVPAFLLIHRFPLAVMMVWLVILPFLTDIPDGGSLKLVYWMVHRMLPVAAVVVVLVSNAVGAGSRRLGRLHWAEFAMLAYVAVSVLSILFLSDDQAAEIRRLYDRVVVPMSLYLLVRLLRPTAAAMKALTYVLVFILVTQAVAGILAWVAPSLLPGRFAGRLGERTIGTLDHANVFGIVSLAAGTLFLHVSMYLEGWRRRAGPVVFVMAVGMGFATFSRASWLATLVVVAAVAVVYPRAMRRISIIGVLAVVLLVALGGGEMIGDYTGRRLNSAASQESALSRLPVVYASLRMIEAKPITGWGYGNFDKYDLRFQASIDDLFVPDKDHASHNLFLTIGAEQGFLGLITYLGVFAYWLVKTPRAFATLDPDELLGRRFLVLLWAIIFGHVIVTNFSNMKVSFGLAVWWLSLALIGNMVAGTPARRGRTGAGRSPGVGQAEQLR